ncbi:Rst1, partial [Thalictrum thalictroides]
MSHDIIKRIAEESIPRSAENIALAVGALCMVLPPSAHSVTTTASKFLLEWLFQFEHEHRQWSAAITLGLVSTCLHATDHKQKFDIITGLLKVACTSKSTLVKGACGVGLGFACQDHLDTSVEAVNNSASHETSKVKEVNLDVRIVRSLSMIICQLSPSSCGSLQRLCKYFPLNTDNLVKDQASEVPYDSVSILEEDVWGIAGLILGLGKSVSAIYRVGGPDAVIMLKTLLTSWIPYLNYVDQNSSVCNVKPDMMLSVGSCLALPVVMEFCLKVELVAEDELIHMVNGFRELISELLSVKKSGSLHQSLLMVSCIGAGNLLSCILDQGVHSIKTEDVEVLLKLFKTSYTNQYPPIIHFGGMLGVVNALGAGAGILTHSNLESSALKPVQGLKDSSYIRGPILSAPVCEELSALLMQDMFLGAQDSKDRRLQKYAAWAVSFLRHRWWSKEPNIVDKSFNEQFDSKPSQTFSEDSVVWKLSLWLEELNYIK